jgi:hypothetical protein
MALPQQYKVTSVKSACDRGHNWITKSVEKLSSPSGKFATIRNGYNKIRPKIFSKGEYKEQKPADIEDDECTREARQRYHSIDVIDGKVREAYKEQLGSNLKQVSEGNGSRTSIRASRETLLAGTSIELRIVDALSTPKRYNRWRTNSFVAASTDDDNDMKLMPSVLLTYNPKFIKIDSTRRYSLNVIPNESFHSIDSTA